MHMHAQNTCAYTHMHNRYMYIYNIFKGTEDIAAGQEIFHRYGGPQWFETKNIPYTDVDYASTRWRPDLQPLPCRKNVIQTTGADGRHMYIVLEAVPPGAILEISLCLEVPVIVVDQFLLWDFVVIDATAQTVCAREDAEVCWQPSILIRRNILLSNPAGMPPSVIRRANPDHIRS